MKKESIISFFLFIVFFFGSAIVVFADPAPKIKDIQAKIVATELNDDGEPTELALELDDEWYHVDMDAKGKELLEFVNETINATVEVREVKEGESTYFAVKVISYEISD